MTAVTRAITDIRSKSLLLKTASHITPTAVVSSSTRPLLHDCKHIIIKTHFTRNKEVCAQFKELGCLYLPEMILSFQSGIFHYCFGNSELRESMSHVYKYHIHYLLCAEQNERLVSTTLNCYAICCN